MRPSNELAGRVDAHSSKQTTPLDLLMFHLGGPCAGGLLRLSGNAHLDAYWTDRDAVDAVLAQHHGRVLKDRIRSPLYRRALVATHTLVNRLRVPIGTVATQLLKRETLGHHHVLNALNPYQRRAA